MQKSTLTPTSICVPPKEVCHCKAGAWANDKVTIESHISDAMGRTLSDVFNNLMDTQCYFDWGIERPLPTFRKGLFYIPSIVSVAR
jgi:hypothetical protein